MAALFCRMTTYAEVGAASLHTSRHGGFDGSLRVKLTGPMPQIAIHCRLVVINPPTRAGFTPRVAPKQNPICARTVTKIRYYSDGLLGHAGLRRALA